MSAYMQNVFNILVIYMLCLLNKKISRHQSWLTDQRMWIIHFQPVNKCWFNTRWGTKSQQTKQRFDSRNTWVPNIDKYTHFACFVCKLANLNHFEPRIFYFYVTGREKKKKSRSFTYAAKRFGRQGQIPCLLEWQFFPLIRPELSRAKQAAGRLPKPHTGIAAIMPFQRAQAIREVNYPSWSLLLTLS